MSLPEIFEEYFSALYESRTGIFNDKAEAKARSDAILEQIASDYHVDKNVVKKVSGPRFWDWIRENKLPEPPPEE